MAFCTITEHKNSVIGAVDRLSDELTLLALNLHANPELSFEEVKSAAALIAPLRAADDAFSIDSSALGIEAVFQALVQYTDRKLRECTLE